MLSESRQRKRLTCLTFDNTTAVKHHYDFLNGSSELLFVERRFNDDVTLTNTLPVEFIKASHPNRFKLEAFCRHNNTIDIIVNTNKHRLIDGKFLGDYKMEHITMVIINTLVIRTITYSDFGIYDCFLRCIDPAYPQYDGCVSASQTYLFIYFSFISYSKYK